MNKSLIYSIILCTGGLIVSNAGLAKSKINSNCRDADVVLSKQYPNFDLNHGCVGAYSDADECDPDNTNISDDGSGLVIAGSNKNNIIHGSSGPDTICGGNGNDEIYGEAGDDLIYGDNGDDSVYGGIGNDELHGGNGNDYLSGYDDDHYRGYAADADDDSLYGENGSDVISGGPGDDTLSGGNGNDSLYGGDGVDINNGNKGKDICGDPDYGECLSTLVRDIRFPKDLPGVPGSR
jgi:Ca2+-binding RTX toxin-like protein